MVLKDGACCLVLQTTAVNFGLLSEPEQDATIYAYAGFLNSLSFTIQIVIRSKRKDISSYLALLKKAEEIQDKPLLVNQIKKYRAFVEKIVQENQVLDKKFYIVIPFSAIELGVSSSLGQSFKAKKFLPFPIENILEKAKMALYPKRDHLITQFARLGLKAKQLTSHELLELFYQIYNPEGSGQKLAGVKDYNYPLVAPALAEKPKSNIPSFPAAAPRVVLFGPTAKIPDNKKITQPVSPALTNQPTISTIPKVTIPKVTIPVAGLVTQESPSIVYKNNHV